MNTQVILCRNTVYIYIYKEKKQQDPESNQNVPLKNHTINEMVVMTHSHTNTIEYHLVTVYVIVYVPIGYL